MTRFNITLDHAVKFVLNALKNMQGGEIFVPKLKSYKVKDVVKAISNSKTKVNIIGQRPGEKTHEEMVSINDSENTVEKDDAYIILPNSIYNSLNVKNFLKKNKKAKRVKKNFSYNSFENKKFLSASEIKSLISKNKNKLEI